MRTSLLPLALAVSAVALAGCGSDGSSGRAVDPSGPGEVSGSETLRPDPTVAPAPVPDGEVSTGGLVTVIDPGTGPKLCLGVVLQSSPPQCDGPALADFDFAGFADQAAGVTWGTYALTGTFDGTTFTVTDAIPAALYDTMAPPQEDTPGAACDAPETADAAKATPEDLDATLAAASALPGYATAWLTGDTINVAITEDGAGAEKALRRTWGGPLCVTTVERTDADLNAINAELQSALPTLLTSGSLAPDTLDAEVVFDDGSIQEWVDATYGAGLVDVSSALTPVG